MRIFDIEDFNIFIAQENIWEISEEMIRDIIYYFYLLWGWDIMKGEYINSTIKEMLEKLETNIHISSEKTIEFGLEVYSLCSEVNYEVGMAFAAWRIGQSYLNMSKYEKAMPYLFHSINLCQRQNIWDLQLLTYLTIGDIYFDIEEYEKSLDYYNSAEKLTKVITNGNSYFENTFEYYAAKIYNRIGEIYRIHRCYDDAIIYYNLANNLEIKLNYKATLGAVLSNLGNVQYHLGNYDKALEYLKESLTYLKSNNYKIGMVEAYGLVALTHEKKENYEESEKYFFRAMSISAEIDYAYIKIDLFLDFISFLENIGNRELAIDKLDEVYSISTDNKMYAKTMEICKRAIRLYEKVNDVNNANKYYKLYFENEEKLEPIEFENRTRNLKIKIKLDSLEKENKKILEKSEALKTKTKDLTEIIKNISIISELGEKITTTLDLNEIYKMLHDTIQTFMQASTFGVALYSDDMKKIHYQYLIDKNKKIESHEVNLDNKTSMAVKCLREKRIIVINDIHNEYLNYIDNVDYVSSKKNSDSTNSVIFCPLIIDNNLIGVMTVQALEKDSFKTITIEMMKALSTFAAIAINNAIKSMNLLAEVEQRRKVQIQLENTNNKLTWLSENDGLTDIPNRRKFDTFINEEWNKAKEKKSVISIILFDIDFFKQYNDNYGHTHGDNCLISISKELSKSLVKNYFAARYGGDEFVIVLPDTNLEEA
jgi:tetratricopeptide (TPR) repeat protein